MPWIIVAVVVLYLAFGRKTATPNAAMGATLRAAIAPVRGVSSVATGNGVAIQAVAMPAQAGKPPPLSQKVGAVAGQAVNATCAAYGGGPLCGIAGSVAGGAASATVKIGGKIVSSVGSTVKSIPIIGKWF